MGRPVTAGAVFACVALALFFSSPAFGERAPAVCIIAGGDHDAFRRALGALERLGADVSVSFPPHAVFGRFPADAGAALAGLPARIVRDAAALSGADLPAPTAAALRRLLSAESTRTHRLRGRVPAATSVLIPTPPPADGLAGRSARDGGAASAGGRRFYQNSEVLFGKILVNLVFPESVEGQETWTVDEIGRAVSGIADGLDALCRELRWVDLQFSLNYEEFMMIRIDDEPIETMQMYAAHWIGMTMAALGFDTPGADVHLAVHELNERERARHGTDWAFTAFIVDQSAHYDPDAGAYDDGCWNGSPVISWAMHGGPYCVVPFPACRLGYGEGFSRSFVRELCHVFWALDEFGMARLGCDTTAGYLAVPNRNTEYMPCTGIVPCVMREVTAEGDLNVCEWTMGQVGLADEDWNSIPDVMQAPPAVEFIEAPGVNPDTIYEDRFVVGARITGIAGPNMNPVQLALYPGDMNDVRQRLLDGAWYVNGLPVSAFDAPPADGEWNETEEDVLDTLSGFEPGLNIVRVEGRNIVGYRGGADRDVLFVGLAYYGVSLESGEESNVVAWETSSEVFGAVFSVERRDMTFGGEPIVVATVDTPVETGYRRSLFRWEDATILPGRRYGYRIVGRFTLVVDGEPRSYRVSSREVDVMTIVPFGDEFVSPLLPNPAADIVVFTIDVPVRWESASDYPGGGGLIEARSLVDVKVFDVAGRRVRTLYNRSRYGGPKTIVWDTRDHRGRAVAPGIYFVRVAAGGHTACRKVVVVR